MHSVFMKIARLTVLETEVLQIQQEGGSFPLPLPVCLNPGLEGLLVRMGSFCLLAHKILGASAACQQNKGTNCDVDIC